jgi:hypothetical protein
VNSAEFSEWIAFWTVEAEHQQPAAERPPTPDELTAKIHATFSRFKRRPKD